MNRFLSKFKNDTKGAISVFFVMIIAVVFFFHAVLIDYARILAVEQNSEYALQSAVRSALAGYDNDLREYGLFGFDEGSWQEADFKAILKENLEPTSNAEAFSFIDPKVENVGLDFSRPLADPDILNHQILEEMKYKAPVEVVKELIEKFLFVTEAMKETSAFIDTAEKIQKDFEKREEHLDIVEDIFEQLERDLVRFEKHLTHTDNEDYPWATYFYDVVRHFEEYEETDKRIEKLENDIAESEASTERLEERIKKLKEKLEELEEELEELEEDLEALEDGKKLDPPKTRKELLEEIRDIKKEIKDIKEEIKDAERRIEANDQSISDDEQEIEKEERNRDIFEAKAQEIASEMYTLAKRIVDNLKEISERIEEAQEHNVNITEEVEKAEEDADDNYSEADYYAEGPPSEIEGSIDVDDLANKISENSAKLDEYPYEPKFFEEIKGPIDTAIEQMADIHELFDAIDSDVTASDSESLKYVRDEALERLNLSTDNIKSGSQTLEEDRKEFDEEDEDYIEEKETEAEKDNDEMKDMLDDLESAAEDQTNYDDLKKLVEKYNDYAAGTDGVIEEIDLDGDASNSAASAMTIVDSIFSGIGNILKGARDRLYINEYILLHFESAEPTGIANVSDYAFENREVEYILYGHEIAGANYATALGQLFAIRFALNFIAAFTDNRVYQAGHPLAVFIAALAYSLENTIEDMTNLSSGDPAPLLSERFTPAGVLPIVYHDYLRLFLFMNPSGDKRLRRIMAVIDKNKDVDLLERYTYVNGRLKTSTNLVFVPQIAESLNIIGALDGQTENGRFVFEREANFSY